MRYVGLMQQETRDVTRKHDGSRNVVQWGASVYIIHCSEVSLLESLNNKKHMIIIIKKTPKNIMWTQQHTNTHPGNKEAKAHMKVRRPPLFVWWCYISGSSRVAVLGGGIFRTNTFTQKEKRIFLYIYFFYELLRGSTGWFDNMPVSKEARADSAVED